MDNLGMEDVEEAIEQPASFQRKSPRYDLTGFDDDNVDLFGWAAGGGIEYAITDNVTFGIEYLHYEFGDETIGDVSLPADFSV